MSDLRKKAKETSYQTRSFEVRAPLSVCRGSLASSSPSPSLYRWFYDSGAPSGGKRVGIFNFFKKRTTSELTGTKILVALLSPKFAEIADTDCRCYSQFYSDTTQSVFESSADLLGAIHKGYDVVHLFCDVAASELPATLLLQRCCDSDVQLLWLASENKPEGYVKGFKAAGLPLNLVMTIDRKNARFTDFLASLLQKMSAGQTMPVAWVALSPQNSNDPRNQNAPSCIFAAGRGGVKFR